jgi:phosphate:Na+ symporter
MHNDRQLAMKIDPLEEVIDDLCDAAKANHIDRVTRKECTLENGFVFNDLLTDYERISDHCSNIAVDIIESGQDGVEAHEYHMNHDYRNDDSFKNLFNEYKKKYSFGE